MYTLKFNSPILPYAKFPLTQNKYIQDFLRSYEQDQDKIQSQEAFKIWKEKKSKKIEEQKQRESLLKEFEKSKNKKHKKFVDVVIGPYSDAKALREIKDQLDALIQAPQT